MPLQRLTLENIRLIDHGRAAVAFQQALDRLQQDCADRPALAKARSLSMTVTLTPFATESGDLDSIDVQFGFKTKTPTAETKLHNMRSTADGLLFEELAPENANQTTFPFGDGDAAPTTETATTSGEE